MSKVTEIAKMIDHSLLNPVMDDDFLVNGCELAKKYNTATVCIKPYALEMASKILKGTDVGISTVVGFPHGSNTIAVKNFETQDAIGRGATSIDMVVNVGKVISEDWDYIRKEIGTLNETCKSKGATLKVIFENGFLPSKDLIIKLCAICGEIGVDYVKTSTGYCFVKQDNGTHVVKGSTHEDLKLMRESTKEEVGVKAAGGVRTVDDALKIKDLGVDLIGTSATIALMEEAEERFGS